MLPCCQPFQRHFIIKKEHCISHSLRMPRIAVLDAKLRSTTEHCPFQRLSEDSASTKVQKLLAVAFPNPYTDLSKYKM
jgi:hypothetical protein